LDYEPGESLTNLFGGNSNWRGPIWLPVNFLIVLALKQYHLYFGDNFQVELPTGSGQLKNLDQVADELARHGAHLPARPSTKACRAGPRQAQDSLGGGRYSATANSSTTIAAGAI
jgi:hypothetical protein